MAKKSIKQDLVLRDIDPSTAVLNCNGLLEAPCKPDHEHREHKVKSHKEEKKEKSSEVKVEPVSEPILEPLVENTSTVEVAAVVENATEADVTSIIATEVIKTEKPKTKAKKAKEAEPVSE